MVSHIFKDVNVHSCVRGINIILIFSMTISVMSKIYRQNFLRLKPKVLISTNVHVEGTF